MTDDIVGWTGTALQIIGATALASRLSTPFFAYLIMLPGAGIWAVLAAVADNWALFVMQAFFTVINLLGVCRWRSA